jgi:hypothetical protein
MKLTYVFTAVLGLALAVQSHAGPFGGHKKNKGSQSPQATGRNTVTPAAKNDDNLIGKTPADKSVKWEYTVMLTNASDADLKKVKAALRKEGEITWGKLDEPRFGVKTYLSEDEIRALSENITEVTPSEETNKLMITLNQNEAWPALKKILTENRMQVTHINGDWNRPFQIVVKTPNMPVGMVYAVMGKYIESQNGGVEEVK